jgi:glutamine synthetase
MTTAEILALAKKEDVRFLRLQFTDIMGAIKNVEIPQRQFEKALTEGVLFDGSSIQGFARIEESDMILAPEPGTFRIFPDMGQKRSAEGKRARLICDIYHPNGDRFEGCPRTALRRVVDRAAKLGFTMQAGPEAEFFLFLLDEQGKASTKTHDAAGYFDLTPVDKGEWARRDIVNDLEYMGFEVEAAHHEVAPGQHEIDFKHADALTCADNVATFRFIVRRVAERYGLHATFMPKPIFGINGSGMHVHQSLEKDGKNIFHDPQAEHELSETMMHYIGGVLKHAKGFVAITNPLINSYKRLVPGYEAPTYIAWSERNRSPLARVPDRRGPGTRVEVRVPDPSCNPYLALAVMLAAGLDGIENKIDPGPPVNKNIYTMSQREKRRLKIDELPPDLTGALDYLEKDKVIQDALGAHICEHFIGAKRQEWATYQAQVHQWEVDSYLSYY